MRILVVEDEEKMARLLQQRHGVPVLLEWDNDVPGMDRMNRELSCLQHSSTT